MKIERINENKIKITMSIEELSEREVTLNDLESDAKKARDFFFKILEESSLDTPSVFEQGQLFIEAMTDNNNLFTIIITKIDDLPDISKYNLLGKMSKPKTNRRRANPKNKVSSHIYSFSSLEDILNMCNNITSSHFIGKNSLYKLNNVYYLIFSKYSIRNANFISLFSIITEYSTCCYELDLLEISIKEKAKLIIKDHALQKLYKI